MTAILSQAMLKETHHKCVTIKGKQAKKNKRRKKKHEVHEPDFYWRRKRGKEGEKKGTVG